MSLNCENFETEVIGIYQLSAKDGQKLVFLQWLASSKPEIDTNLFNLKGNFSL
jgi:hypothetical protein